MDQRTDGQMYRRTDGQMDQRTDGHTDRWKNGQMDKRTDGRMDSKTFIIIEQLRYKKDIWMNDKTEKRQLCLEVANSSVHNVNLSIRYLWTHSSKQIISIDEKSANEQRAKTINHIG